MSRLLTEELKNALPPLGGQEGASDPIVYAVFIFPASDWRWFVTEGEATEDDCTFFGFVMGFEREWGYFSLSELGEVNIRGMSIERDRAFKPRKLSTCLFDLNLR